MSIRRTEAIVGQALDLRMSWRYDDSGSLFDPYQVTKVEIWNEDQTVLLETINTVTRLSLGFFQVITSSAWNTSPRTVSDKWFYIRNSGDPTQHLLGSTNIYQVSPAPPTPPTGLPTPDDVRACLEGFQVSEEIISNDFIIDGMNDEIVPYVESFIRSSITGQRTAVEFYSGTGRDELILNRRNFGMVTAIRLVSGNDIDTTINIASLQQIPATGILKVKSGLSEYYNYRIFPKGNDNIQVTYTYGGACSAEIAVAVKKLTAILILDNLEARTGGGQVSGQSYGRQYGNMGKFSGIRKRFSNQAHAILRRYTSSVVGV